MKNSYDSMEDMQRMQQEAVRRVREMQKRATQSLNAGVRYSEANQNNNESVINNSAGNNKIIIEKEEASEASVEKNEIKPFENKKHTINHKNKFDVFSTLLSDHEKSLILLLILILIDEKSDMSLIMALMYLII